MPKPFLGRVEYVTHILDANHWHSLHGGFDVALNMQLLKGSGPTVFACTYIASAPRSAQAGLEPHMCMGFHNFASLRISSLHQPQPASTAPCPPGRTPLGILPQHRLDGAIAPTAGCTGGSSSGKTLGACTLCLTSTLEAGHLLGQQPDLTLRPLVVERLSP